MYDLTIITPTRDRPQAFSLCERWMHRQTFNGNLQWIVVSDSYMYNLTMEQQYLYREPKNGEMYNTVPYNLMAALPYVQADKILIIEDDDYYAPKYLEMMFHLLDEEDLVAEIPAIYYNLEHCKMLRCKNTKHASLCQTGFKSRAIPLVELACDQAIGANSPLVDTFLWKLWPESSTLKKVDIPKCISIKGLPGRRGNTEGWKLSETGWVDKKLHELIGKDAEAYGIDYTS